MDLFIGDTHFGGETIIKYTSRPFKNSKEMDDFIILCWNNKVEKDDTVYVVGDFFDNMDEDFMKSILNRLNGKIVLIKGNHDEGFEDLYKRLSIEVIDFPILYKEWYIISHEPKFITDSMPYFNIFAHVHNNPMYKDYSTQSFCVSAERIKYTPITFEEMMTLVKTLYTKKEE